MRSPLSGVTRHAVALVLVGVVLLASSFLGAPAPVDADPPTWVPPDIYKYADPGQVAPGTHFDFVVSVINDPLNEAIWSEVAITDVLDPAFEIVGVDVDPYADDVSIVGQTVTVLLNSLQPQSYLAVYLHCRLSSSAQPGDVINNIASLTYVDPDGNPRGPVTAQANITVTRNVIHMPLVAGNWPPIPQTPVLQPIANPSGLGSYSVNWSNAHWAELYVLEEATDSGFSTGVVVFEGPQTSYQASGRGATRYYYRVKGRSDWGDSAWSNVEWTDVLWEAEPNDDAFTQANGPIHAGPTYHGTVPSPSDPQDYYYFELPGAGGVDVWLSNISAGNNLDLVLRDASLNLVGYSGRLGNNDEHIFVGGLAPGKYFVQVYNRSGPGSGQAYDLLLEY